MNRMLPAKVSKNSYGLAVPDWIDGKRPASLEQIEQYVTGVSKLKPEVGKRVIKVLMDQVVELQKKSCVSRAKVEG